MLKRTKTVNSADIWCRLNILLVVSLQVDAVEFRNVLEKNQALFPEAPLVYLKELVLFLNQKAQVEVSDVTFGNKPAGYPLNVVCTLFPHWMKLTNYLEVSLTHFSWSVITPEHKHC